MKIIIVGCGKVGLKIVEIFKGKDAADKLCSSVLYK